jgi:hypothetical protein
MEKNDPSLELAVEIFKVLKTRPDADVKDIMASVSLVLTTIAVETGMEEEKAVYAFTKSFRSSKSRLKNLVRQVH